MRPTLMRWVRSNLAALRIMGSRALGRDRQTPAQPDGSPTEPPPEAARTVSATEAETRDTRAVIVLGGGSDIGIAIAAELVARLKREYDAAKAKLCAA